MALQISVHNWQGDVVEDIALPETIFGVSPRKDILARVVAWQLAKRRSGTHKTKGISDIKATTKKPYRQKGTGRARQGSLVSPQFRGGAVIFGPVVRSHAFSLPKKIRQLGLKSALSSRLSEGKLIIIDDLAFSTHKTKEAKKLIQGSVLMIGGETVCEKLKHAISNLPYADLLPQQGLNVYDILRHDRLILSRSVIPYLEGRLSS